MLWLCVTPGCDSGAFVLYRRKPRNDTQPMEIPPIFGSYGTIRLLIVERVTNHKDKPVPSLTTHLPHVPNPIDRRFCGSEHNSRWQRRMGAPLRFAVTRHKETERGGTSAAIFVCVCVGKCTTNLSCTRRTIAIRRTRLMPFSWSVIRPGFLKWWRRIYHTWSRFISSSRPSIQNPCTQRSKVNSFFFFGPASEPSQPMLWVSYCDTGYRVFKNKQ